MKRDRPPMKRDRPPAKCTSDHKCVETPERPCKVIKGHYRNGMGCEDENLVCRGLWRSQAPASVGERIQFVFVTVSCNRSSTLEGTPSIRYCNL